MDGDFGGGFGDTDYDQSTNFDPATNSLTFKSKANHGSIKPPEGDKDVPF
jgi:hypothetical protein